ncbi:rubrerythrin-like domain-containing protein [Halapricum salinum]|uniref:Rubrerythrin-like domain-containing protein n=1 Tax=Halapricum salinum TaxID=1457250 RepID=A0A4D6HHX0_9EURY|nr:rubrerythrin-like domain-containing protein [Halapricum salinum]
MSSRLRFECADCGKRVVPASYRAACPECQGELCDSTFEDR